IEYHCDPGRRRLLGAQQASGPHNGVATGPIEVEVARAPAHGVAAAAHGLVALARQGVGAHRAARTPVAGGDAVTAGHGRLHAAVAVAGVGHLADARVAGPDPALELEGELYLPVRGERRQLVAPQVEVGG